MSQTRSLVALLEEKLVQVAISATRPSSGSDGVDITSWRTGGAFSSPLATVFVDGSQAANVTSPTGGSNGVELWGFRLSQWWLIGYLNNGSAIPVVGDTQGFAQEIDVVGVFDRLAVAGTMSAGSGTAKLVPMEQWQ